MKEVTNLPQSLCGLTQYFGDRYSLGQCVYKKCIDECVEGQYEFTFAGQKYNRKRYCCNNDDLCNGKNLFIYFHIISFYFIVMIIIIKISFKY